MQMWHIYGAGKIYEDFSEVETYLQFVFLLLSVPIIYQEASLLFISKRYPFFIFLIIWFRLSHHICCLEDTNYVWSDFGRKCT